jgi:hypothetical protein
MNEFRDEIMNIRAQNPELRPSAGRGRGGYGGGKGVPKHRNQNKKYQTKVKELKLQNDQLKVTLAALKSGDATDDKGSNAGDAFGGRAAMSKKPA